MIWRNINKIITLLSILLCVLLVEAQTDTTKLVKYGPGFRFYDGLYLNFEQVRNNKPIQKNRIETNINKHDLNFFDKLLKAKKIYYFDDYGLKHEVIVSDVWGYSRKGSLYVQWGDTFNRIPIVGNICHFVATIRVYQDRYYDPYYSRSYYNTMTPTNSSVEIRQYLLDFETGKIIDYTYLNVLVVLMRDQQLYDEFNELKKRKQKEQKFMYIREYNKKHPLYIPVN